MISIIRLDIVFESISFFISLAIFAIAFAAAKKTSSRSLTLLSLGFLLMAVAMLIRVVLTSWALGFPASTPPRLRVLPFLVLQVQEVVYSLIRIAGYAVFLHLYSSYRLTKNGATPFLVALPVSFIYNPFFEAISALLLTFVIYLSLKTRPLGQSSLVVAGFVFLLLSHLLSLILPASLLLYFAAQFCQLVSLILFMTAVLSVLLHGEGL